MNDTFISNYIKNIEISGIRKFFNEVVNYKEAISLTLGQPDFPVPLKIKEGLTKAIEENKTGYTSNMGLLELREEISHYLNNLNISYNPEEICLTVGGSEGLFNVFITLLNPNDKVLIPRISYPAYESLTKLVGAIPEFYDLNEDFSLNTENIEKLIKEEKPKALVLSFPSNPTGAILTKDERERIFQIVKNNNIVIISDEIYSSLCFDDEYYSISQCEEIKSKMILVSGFSKMFSMTGLRVGYVCTTENYMKHIVKVHQYNTSCAPSIVQWALAREFRNSLEDILYMKEEFKRRRNYVYGRLKDMGLEVSLPKGAFYIFPSIKKYKLSSEEFAFKLLKEGGVAIVPGSAFGAGGEGFIRISYAYSMEELKEALDRMERFIKTKLLG